MPRGVAMHGAWATAHRHGRSPPLRPGLPADHGVVGLTFGRHSPGPKYGDASGVGQRRSTLTINSISSVGLSCPPLRAHIPGLGGLHQPTRTQGPASAARSAALPEVLPPD